MSGKKKKNKEINAGGIEYILADKEVQIDVQNRRFKEVIKEKKISKRNLIHILMDAYDENKILKKNAEQNSKALVEKNAVIEFLAERCVADKLDLCTER